MKSKIINDFVRIAKKILILDIRVKELLSLSVTYYFNNYKEKAHKLFAEAEETFKNPSKVNKKIMTKQDYQDTLSSSLYHMGDYTEYIRIDAEFKGSEILPEFNLKLKFIHTAFFLRKYRKAQKYYDDCLKIAMKEEAWERKAILLLRIVSAIDIVSMHSRKYAERIDQLLERCFILIDNAPAEDELPGLDYARELYDISFELAFAGDILHRPELIAKSDEMYDRINDPEFKSLYKESDRPSKKWALPDEDDEDEIEEDEIEQFMEDIQLEIDELPEIEDDEKREDKYWDIHLNEIEVYAKENKIEQLLPKLEEMMKIKSEDEKSFNYMRLLDNLQYLENFNHEIVQFLVDLGDNLEDETKRSMYYYDLIDLCIRRCGW